MWITPYTTRIGSEKESYVDMNRICGNLNHLFPLLDVKDDWAQGDMVDDVNWSKVYFAIKSFADMWHEIYGEYPFVVPNKSSAWDNLNLIESATQKLKDMFTERATYWEYKTGVNQATVYTNSFPFDYSGNGYYRTPIRGDIFKPYVYDIAHAEVLEGTTPDNYDGVDAMMYKYGQTRRYSGGGISWVDVDIEGWGAGVWNGIEYNWLQLLGKIAGKPLMALNQAFRVTRLQCGPRIPNTVTLAQGCFARSDIQVYNHEIPESVTDMREIFTFCENLGGSIEINCSPATGTISTSRIYNAFYETVENITIHGRSTVLQEIADTANGNNVTVVTND